ncbi:MAG: hypothetical protein ACLR8P_12730 [Clostridium fessum]
MLLGRELHNVCAVVTRYFGGTLFGNRRTELRACGGAVQEGLKNCVVLEKMLAARKWKIGTDYSGLGKVQYILAKQSCRFWAAVRYEGVDLTITWCRFVEGGSSGEESS